jgi:hypothetical protein
MVQTQDELFADNVKVFILRIHLVSNMQKVRLLFEATAKIGQRELPLLTENLPLRL